jgi:hypothetical protein
MQLAGSCKDPFGFAQGRLFAAKNAMPDDSAALPA